MDQVLLDLFNEWFEDYYGIDDPVELDVSGTVARCFGFAFGEILEEDELTSYWISFNDEITTSQLVMAAIEIVPKLAELTGKPFQVIECYAPVYDKEGVITEILYETGYQKNFKKLKPPKVEKTPKKAGGGKKF